MTIQPPPAGPQAWKSEDVSSDDSWVLRLTPEEVDGFRVALQHALKVDKPLLDMEQADYPLPEESRLALERAIATTQGRWGMCLVKGFPTDEWTEAEMRLSYWGMGLYMGVGRTQNRASEVINDVRDAGGSYKVKGGRGYNTNAGLDFHQDSCDVVALLCRRTAKAGGSSKVMSSIALRDRVKELRPDLIPVLEANDWFHSFQGAQDPTQPPFYRCPIFGDVTPFCARTNRKNMVAAQRDFDEVPRLSAKQTEALDLFDEIMPSDEYCYSMELERGDMQLLNSFVTLHSRTPFEDFEDPDQKRHLMRLWMSIPISQPLPATWEEYWGDSRAGSVRGGVRGSAITPEFSAYERRQAKAMDMPLKPFKPVLVRSAPLAAGCVSGIGADQPIYTNAAQHQFGNCCDEHGSQMFPLEADAPSILRRLRPVAPSPRRSVALTIMGPERPRCNGAEEKEQRVAFTELRRGVSANTGVVAGRRSLWVS